MECTGRHSCLFLFDWVLLLGLVARAGDTWVARPLLFYFHILGLYLVESLYRLFWMGEEVIILRLLKIDHSRKHLLVPRLVYLLLTLPDLLLDLPLILF